MTVAISTPPSTNPPNKYGSSSAVFDAAMQAHLAWQAGMISALSSQNAENNSINSNINTQTTAAAASATAAGVSADSAATGASSQVWISGVTYPVGYVAYSPITYRTYRRKTLGAGTTDPSRDQTNWALLTLEIDTGYPALLPSLNLDFANSQVIDPRITFTRATSATRVNSRGLIETVVAGVPRIDYDPVTLECKGLLVEEARTNLLTYSEQFDNAAWGKTDVSVTVNSVTAPDGTLIADTVVELATTAWHRLQAPSVSVTATTYAFFVYAKAGNRSTLQIVPNGSMFPVSYANFDLATGTVSAHSGLDATPTIEALPNGWYRCTVVDTATSAASATPFYVGPCSSTTQARAATYTGDGTSGLYIWGAQLEAGSFPTSYIPTVAAAVTRNAEAASMTGTNFSSWFNVTEGTFLAEWRTVYGATVGSNGTRVFVTSDGTNNERIIAYTANLATISAGATAGSTPGSGAYLDPTGAKAAWAYKLNQGGFSKNGGAEVSDTSFGIPTGLNQISLCDNSPATSTTKLNGHIKSLRYYPERLTAAQLQALSTL